MAYGSFSCLQTGIRINSCCLSMGSMLKPEAPRFFSSFRRFTAAVQNGRIGSKIRKMNRPSVIRARGHMVSLYPYRHIVSTSFWYKDWCFSFTPWRLKSSYGNGFFRYFLEKVSRDNHHSDHVNRRGRQNRFLRQFFLPHCQLLSIDGSFTNFYQRCSLWESLTYIYGCRRPYIYWIFRGFYGIVKP